MPNRASAARQARRANPVDAVEGLGIGLPIVPTCGGNQAIHGRNGNRRDRRCAPGGLLCLRLATPLPLRSLPRTPGGRTKSSAMKGAKSDKSGHQKSRFAGSGQIKKRPFIRASKKPIHQRLDLTIRPFFHYRSAYKNLPPCVILSCLLACHRPHPSLLLLFFCLELFKPLLCRLYLFIH